MAKYSKSPVIITGDINCGGVFASLIGTMMLLTPSERRLVKALHINKFRGDLDILKPGLDFLIKKSKRPLLGVTPYIDNLQIAQEDHLPDDKGDDFSDSAGMLKIAVIVLPHISNTTDFDILEHEPQVRLKYFRRAEPLTYADIIIIPGTKNTLFDLAYLRKYGYDRQIKKLRAQGAMIIGICGGYQMLGNRITDAQGNEWKAQEAAGLGLLDVETVFRSDKITAQVKGRAGRLPFYDGIISGYEIHMGDSRLGDGVKAAFSLIQRGDVQINQDDGAARDDAMAWGTYIHGIFDNDDFRRSLLGFMRLKRGISAVEDSCNDDAIGCQERSYDRLADIVRASIDMDLLYSILDAGV